MLRYAAEYKDPDEPLPDFVVRRGGLNECVARFVRRLGRGARIPCSLRCPSFLSVVISFCDLNLKVGTALL